MSGVGIFPPVEDIYPGLDGSPQCLRHLVQQLSRTDALLWCGRLNLVLSNPWVADREGQHYAVDTFFTEADDRKRLHRWVKDQREPESVNVFFRGQLLELARWLCIYSRDLAEDGHSFEQPRHRRVFSQAALVAASVWAERVYPELRVDGEASELRRRVMPNVRTSFIENGRSALPLVVLGRGWLTWTRWMPEVWGGVDDLFSQSCGMTLEEYFQCMAALFVQQVDVRPEKARKDNRHSGLFDGRFWQNATHMGLLFERFLRTEASSVEDICRLVRASDAGGHIPVFRAHPVLRTPDGRAIVIDPVFLVEHASVGPLFLLARGLRGRREANLLFGRFGDAFELYVGDLLRRRYPDRPALQTRVSTKVRLRRRSEDVGEMDAVVITGAEEACLIEAKGVFLADRAATDGQSYLRELSRKYARLDEAPDERPKGIAQLAKFIVELSNGNLDEVPDALKDATILLPVLVAHDHNIDCPGHAEFLLEHFVAELRPDEVIAGRYLRKGSLRIDKPVILSVDDFEWLESSLQNVSLGAFLKDYAAWAPDRVKSVRDFVAASAYRRQWRGPEVASQAAGDVIDQLCMRAFGSKPSGSGLPVG